MTGKSNYEIALLFAQAPKFNLVREKAENLTSEEHISSIGLLQLFVCILPPCGQISS